MRILNWFSAKSSESVFAGTQEVLSHSDSNDELVNSYIDLAGVATDIPSHGLAMRDYLKSVNPSRETEADEIGKKFQARVGIAELKGAKRGAEYVARRLSRTELQAAVHCFETVGYRRFNQIAVAVENGQAVSQPDRQTYEQQRTMTWMQSTMRFFGEWTANPAHFDELNSEILDICDILNAELAASGLKGAQKTATDR